ncbi:hypothetical protein M752DRAFT_285345 [Aspergillus phoenicis ATCC 13157]|uniref:Uncharacterized protein n=1 Tax=Aspergillus phoenicis ATCC 13157 TaxID=1353007 RepID=A0A370PCN0_ASPPH|nr:hypothetical protein M752DRAFT_285345 [Aspergillus phoenicis ATCC 13157]
MMPLSKGMYHFVDNIVEVTADMMNAAFQSVDILGYYGLQDGEDEYIPIDWRGHGAVAWCRRNVLCWKLYASPYQGTRHNASCYFCASIPLGDILTNSLAQDHFHRLTKRCTVSPAYVAAIYATKIFESSLALLGAYYITFGRYQDEGTMELYALEESRTQRPEPSKPNMGMRDCRDHQHVPKGSWMQPGKKTHSLKSSLSGSGSRAEKYYELRLSRESGNVTLKLSALTIEFSLRASVCTQCHVAGMNEQDSVRSGE